MSTCIAIITARGGSKRIPRKNIKPFLGKPIIAYSIEAAKQSECFDEIMVSTDDEEIAQISIECGAKVPFMRSKENSTDYATTADVLVEVLNEYNKRKKLFDYACCLYPTAPFVTADLLIQGLDILNQKNVSSVIPVVRISSNFLRAMKIQEDRLNRLYPEYENVRTQDLPSLYLDAAQFYWFSIKSFLKNKKILNEETLSMVLSSERVQDIDTIEDWVEAECKYQRIYDQKSKLEDVV